MHAISRTVLHCVNVSGLSCVTTTSPEMEWWREMVWNTIFCRWHQPLIVIFIMNMDQHNCARLTAWMQCPRDFTVSDYWLYNFLKAMHTHATSNRPTCLLHFAGPTTDLCNRRNAMCTSLVWLTDNWLIVFANCVCVWPSISRCISACLWAEHW